MADEGSTAPQDPRPAHRHWLGFLVAGGLATATDALLLEAGVQLLGASPLLARLGSISGAMIVGWLAHRRLAFAVAAAPSLREFVRYAIAAWTSVAVNYLVFALLLLAKPDLIRVGALLAATSISMIFSYVAMRYGVFRSSA